MRRPCLPPDSPPNPLSSEDFRHKLFMYEDAWAAGRHTPAAYAFLSTAYQSLVAHYDRHNDPTKEYFLHKMQGLMTAWALTAACQAQAEPSPRHAPTAFEAHQQLKLRKLDFDISVRLKKGQENEEAVRALIAGHSQTSQKLQRHIVSQSIAQASEFDRKLEERKNRSMSRSMALWSFTSPLKRGSAETGPGKPPGMGVARSLFASNNR